MKHTKKTMLSFYRLMGKIFYATAKADGQIHENEVATLKQLVRDRWLNLEETTDEFDTDAAYQIEIVFDYLVDNDSEEENILDELEDFKDIHSSLFSPEISKLIMDTASDIAASFAQSNKSEVVFLSELWLILKE